MEHEFKIGDKVRIKAGITNPAYGWGNVGYDHIGSVIDTNLSFIFVDFPTCNSWRGLEKELELVTQVGKRFKKPISTLSLHSTVPNVFTNHKSDTAS